MQNEIKDIAEDILEKKKKSTLIKYLMIAVTAIILMGAFLLNLGVESINNKFDYLAETQQENYKQTVSSDSTLMRMIVRLSYNQCDMQDTLNVINKTVKLNTFKINTYVNTNMKIKKYLETIEKGYYLNQFSPPKNVLDIDYKEPNYHTIEADHNIEITYINQDIEKKN